MAYLFFFLAMHSQVVVKTKTPYLTNILSRPSTCLHIIMTLVNDILYSILFFPHFFHHFSLLTSFDTVKYIIGNASTVMILSTARFVIAPSIAYSSAVQVKHHIMQRQYVKNNFFNLFIHILLRSISIIISYIFLK